MDQRKHILTFLFSRWRPGSHPSIVVAGFATHTIKKSNDSAEAMAEYQKDLEELLPVCFFRMNTSLKVLPNLNYSRKLSGLCEWANLGCCGCSNPP
jgi:hypothetical protein